VTWQRTLFPRFAGDLDVPLPLEEVKKMTKKKNALIMILFGLAVLFLFSSDAQAWRVPYPGGDVKWDNAGRGGVRYPGGEVTWGQYRGGVRFPGGNVRWGNQGRGGVGINLPGVNFNVGW